MIFITPKRDIWKLRLFWYASIGGLIINIYICKLKFRVDWLEEYTVYVRTKIKPIVYAYGEIEYINLP